MIRCGAAVLWIACTMQVVVTCSGCGGTGQVPPARLVRQAMIEDFHVKPVAMVIDYMGPARFPISGLIWYSTEDGRKMAPPLVSPPQEPLFWGDIYKEEKVDEGLLAAAFAGAVQFQRCDIEPGGWATSVLTFYGEDGRRQSCYIGKEEMYLFYRRLDPLVPADSYFRQYVVRIYSTWYMPREHIRRLLNGEATLDELRGR